MLRRRKEKGCGRRKNSWVLSDIFWIIYFVCSPQIRVSRDSCPIKGFLVCFSAIVLTDYCHLCGQSCLHFHYPTLISYYLYGLSSFLGHC